MGNKQYYVSKDNGLEKLKQDVNERFGNLFGGNYCTCNVDVRIPSI